MGGSGILVANITTMYGMPLLCTQLLLTLARETDPGVCASYPLLLLVEYSRLLRTLKSENPRDPANHWLPQTRVGKEVITCFLVD